MQDLPIKPSCPRQLQMQFDSKRLRGMSLQERQQVVTCLAIFLAEAAGASEPAGSDEGR